MWDKSVWLKVWEGGKRLRQKQYGRYGGCHTKQKCGVAMSSIAIPIKISVIFLRHKFEHFQP